MFIGNTVEYQFETIEYFCVLFWQIPKDSERLFQIVGNITSSKRDISATRPAMAEILLAHPQNTAATLICYYFTSRIR